MISFKAFVNTIHSAIMDAADFLTQQNQSILDKYFDAKETVDEQGNKVTSLVPKTVVLQYHRPDVQKPDTVEGETDDHQFQSSSFLPATTGSTRPAPHQIETKETEVHVPLITLVPLSMPQVEKATIRADFLMKIVDDELQLEFSDGDTASRGLFRKSRVTRGTLEITISPQAPTEGLRNLIDAYENQVKQQIP